MIGWGMVSGCSESGEYPTAPVRGKVLFNGQPVPNAAVSFTPQKSAETGGAGMAGKSAAGITDGDGVFVLSTYGAEDGALVGRHVVSVASGDANQPLPGKTPPDLYLEVKRGSNDFTIELLP